MINKIYLNGRKILIKNVDLTEGTNKEKYFDSDTCYNLFDVLDEYVDLFDKVDYVIVEKQMAFGKKINTMALKLGQSCQSYFMMNYGRKLKVIEFPAYYKTLILGAPQTETKLKMVKRNTKHLEIKKEKNGVLRRDFYILSLREDFETMSEIGLMKKKMMLMMFWCNYKHLNIFFLLKKCHFNNFNSLLK